MKKLKKVDNEKKKKLQKGTEDDMAGGFELKRLRVEEESSSWLQRCNDDSQHRQVKHKRVKKECASRKQRGTDASRGGSEHHQVQHKKDAEFEVLEVLNFTSSELLHPESNKWCQSWSHVNFIAKPKNTDCNVSPKHFFGEFFIDDDSRKFNVTYCSTFEPSDDPGSKEELMPLEEALSITKLSTRKSSIRESIAAISLSKENSLFDIMKRIKLRHAKMALEFYKKRQDAEFEVLEVLNFTSSELQHPESKWGRSWSHVNFIAKPKNTDCNVSPKHFFGEFYKDDDSGKFHVTYCSTFEPSDDPGVPWLLIFKTVLLLKARKEELVAEAYAPVGISSTDIFGGSLEGAKD
ncbi:hypothetical protein DCAR_0520772 [Daucus carota subsp. sativus]|uniref:DUF3615 domain-containing protein n=1 Tax=Daucus carota subsp. sativus TaxID=79200 RepID=A0AAF0X577_DAUCS|nr:hypothetical protein DCAR_0520772 [Daucus carota subsp. sativus]